MVIFHIYPRLKEKGGAEKLLLTISESFAKENEVFILSDDQDPEIPQNVKHLYVPLNSSKRILNTVFILRKLIKKHHPDLIHSHHRLPTMLFSLIKRSGNFKLIHTAHNTFFDKKIFGKTKADKYIAVGKEVEKNLIEYFKLPSDRVTTIYNGVPKVEIVSSDELKLKRTAVVVGRLSEQKGHYYLFEAWKKVASTLPDVRLFVIGDGLLREQLEKQVNENNLNSSVTFMGFQTNVAEWMGRSEFVILPSLWEGLPLTVLEAFAAKKTVVATGVDGTKEIVRNELTGLLVEEKNPDHLADAIIELFQNPDLRIELEKQAYKLYLAEFTVEKMLASYHRLIKDII